MAEQRSMAEEIQRDVSTWRWMLSAMLYFWAAAGVVAAGAGVAGLVVYERVMGDRPGGTPVTLEVPEGASGGDVGKLLTEKGFIEDERLFRLAMRLDPDNRSIRHGVYELPMGLSPHGLLALMRKGPDRQLKAEQQRVTIPEGLSIVQMAERFEDPQAFIAAASDEDLRAAAGVEADTLEGYLMPNTYFFDEKPNEREAVERMLEQFLRDYAALALEIPGGQEFDRNAIVTVASLVEEEARADEERPLVASVIYNRLAQNMPLQMDSTLQFALGKYGQRMLDADKEVKSPYNTYKERGLPPGPISSPGLASLRAAMQPAATEYLYFVSNADGVTHTFSRTLSEHNAAVARFNREIAQQRREQQQRGAQ
ncbi:MAG: endolytic transglycosylase MltG [Candidatus Hydrogenedens sp.]|nr:endolytic transglycosylase MltG [Candidatus Hydrogenedens sp.]